MDDALSLWFLQHCQAYISLIFLSTSFCPKLVVKKFNIGKNLPVELTAPLSLFDTYSPFKSLNPIVDRTTTTIVVVVDRTMSQTQMQTVGNGESSQKINYATHVQDIIKLKGHQTCIIGSIVTALC